MQIKIRIISEIELGHYPNLVKIEGVASKHKKQFYFKIFSNLKEKETHILVGPTLYQAVDISHFDSKNSSFTALNFIANNFTDLLIFSIADNL